MSKVRFVQCAGLLVVAAAVVGVRESARRPCRLTLVASLLEESEALLGKLDRPVEVLFFDGGHTEHVEPERGATSLTQAAMQLKCLPRERLGRRDVIASVRHLRCSRERAGASCCRTLLALKRS